MKERILIIEDDDGIVRVLKRALSYENYQVFAELSRALRSGGRLVVETVNRDFLVTRASPRSWFEKDGLLVLEERRFDPVTGRSEVDVIVVEGAERRAYHHSIRLYSAPELAMLLASAGIETLSVFGDFDGGPLTADAAHLILVGRRR